MLYSDIFKYIMSTTIRLDMIRFCQQFQHWEVDLEVNSRHCILNFKWKKKNLVK
jgi:hypothetical protein